jgi:hypothetical protein
MHPTSGFGMQSRAAGASGYSARSAASTNNKDLGALAGINKGALGPVKNSAATNAKGPKT